MDDVSRQDLKLFLKELAQPWRLILMIMGLAFLWTVPLFPGAIMQRIVITVISLGAWISTSYATSITKRFRSKKFAEKWAGCQDRMRRFEEVLKRLRKDQIANLSEMPENIRKTGRGIYYALRRADVTEFEVSQTENAYYAPPSWNPPSHDAQSKELYRLADKNIAEYRQKYAGVMAGVHRTEAQTAVYMTTLDTLRMQMLGYRLVGRSPEMSSHDFLEALAEARAQLQSIDTALDELDLGHYPKTISVVPPPIPTEAAEEIERRLSQGP